MRRQEVIDRLRAHEGELRARGVGALFLFGSHARDEARPAALPQEAVHLGRELRAQLLGEGGAVEVHAGSGWSASGRGRRAAPTTTRPTAGTTPAAGCQAGPCYLRGVPGPDTLSVLYDADAIGTAVRTLAARLAPRLAGKPTYVVPVMNGALFFAADLLRALPREVPIVGFGVACVASSIGRLRRAVPAGSRA